MDFFFFDRLIFQACSVHNAITMRCYAIYHDVYLLIIPFILT